jgi:GDP-L-fucose synthase
MITKDSKIYIAGHNGMVGSACWKILKKEGYDNLVGRSSKEIDLRNQQEVFKFIEIEKPDIIIDAAAKVGGILANDSFPYEFLLDNMLIQNNLIKSAHELNVKKFIFLGSSCVYPKLAPQPLKENYLLSQSLEPTNQWYAIAKISGIKLCESIRLQFKKDFVSLMPTNLYGPHDNFSLTSSHVLPAMIRKFHEAKENNHATVELWGSGNPLREFLHVDDLAQAVLFTVENILPENLYNIGTGMDITIKNLAEIIQKETGHKGFVFWDKNKPDGTPRKLMDVSKMNKLGWKYKYDLKNGITSTYKWFIENKNSVKKNDC